MADFRDVDKIEAELEAVKKERNEMSWRITILEMALAPLANLADQIIEQKSMAWARHWEALPINMIYKEDGNYTMPKIEHCLKAKRLAEGESE